MPHQKLLDRFKDHQIDYDLHTHEPLFTVEDAHKLSYAIKGAHSKNLFLRDKKKNFFLVTVLDSKRVDLKTLSKNYGAGHFSFGNADELLRVLGVIPGSVTPFGLINDEGQQVNFLFDKDFMTYDFVNFHPLRNDMTINICLNQFLKFFEKIGRRPQMIEIPQRD
jgi:Ala-tRNA(Pro) deacylase